MTDFVQFLYTQYIQSYIDAMPMDAYVQILLDTTFKVVYNKHDIGGGEMTDFVQFLYTQYIQSYIDAMPMDAADEYHHDLVKNECTPDLWTDIEAIRAFAEAIRAFAAAHAFLLGLRTGAGLAAHGRM